MSTFADRLKELRGPESLASFAEQLGINRVQYFKYESGKNAPSVDVLANICRVHACSADWLLGLKDSRGVAAGTERVVPKKKPAADLDGLRATAAQLAEEAAALADTIKKLKKML